DDHRLEPGRDPVQMPGGVAIAVREHRPGERRRTDPRLTGEHPEHRALGLDRVADDHVKLGAVAGRDRHRLTDLTRAAKIAQQHAGALLAQRHPLAALDGRGLVRTPDREQLGYLPASSGSSATEPSRSRSRARRSSSARSSARSRWLRDSLTAMITT